MKGIAYCDVFFLENCSENFSLNSSNLTFRIGEKDVSNYNTVFWFPSFSLRNNYSEADKSLSDADLSFLIDQWDAFALLIESECEIFFPASPSRITFYSNRAISISTASRFGINTPQFLFTTRIEDAVHFVNDLGKIGKEVLLKRITDNRFFIDGRASVPVHIEERDLLNTKPKRIPLWLEEYVISDKEYRIFITKSNFLTFKVEKTDGEVDSRHSSPIKFHAIDPLGIEKEYQELCKKVLKLPFCCFDVIEREDIFFLIDINPLGTAHGFSALHQNSIAKLIVDELTRI